jgi:hypothetical protein
MTATTVTNLDRYGNEPLPWSRARDLLDGASGTDVRFFLHTTDPDGRPHATGIGAVWHDGSLWIVSGPGTRKSRNLAADPRCTVSVPFPSLDVVLEGRATRVTDTDTLERLAAIYRDGGWEAEVAGDAFTAPYSAPSAGPPPWYLYQVTVETAVGVAAAEPHGATRWDFEG